MVENVRKTTEQKNKIWKQVLHICISQGYPQKKNKQPSVGGGGEILILSN